MVPLYMYMYVLLLCHWHGLFRTSDVDLILTEKRWKGVEALMDGHVSCSGHVCVHTPQPKFDVVWILLY